MCGTAIREKLAGKAPGYAGMGPGALAGVERAMDRIKTTHKGDWCICDVGRFCQEGTCNDCIIRRELALMTKKNN